jgi:acyl-CoA synthetase (NDP forming)
MVNRQLTDPESIVVVGASNNLTKPGGKLFYNILTGTFSGELFALNPREDSIQGFPSYHTVEDLPETDLAILAIPASLCLETVRDLALKKQTRAFIIVSAGFSEENQEGARIEKEIAQVCRMHGAALIGPNCIGVMTPSYQGVFTLPIPKLEAGGCDFISGSGATAVFIMEAGLQKGLKFNHVFSVGNSALMGVEDVLAWLDETYREGSSSKVKILYFETIKDPDSLLMHASSLIRKGCRIAAVKAGTTDAGSRAATSHTGALASSDMAVDALFRKAGIVRCYGREDLTTVACVMMSPPLNGKNLAIITHAGGPAVMLTDVLAQGGMDVPHLEGPEADRLLTHLHPGSSAANPIDLLATGNAEQLGISIDFCEHSFPQVNGIVVIFGTPGLAPVFDVYQVLHEKMLNCSKPIFPVLPSVTTAKKEVEEFLSRGHINFPDEVMLGQALTRIYQTEAPAGNKPYLDGIDLKTVRRVIDASENGYLDPEEVSRILDAGGIPRVREALATDEEQLFARAGEIGYPLAMKVVGPVHKSDVGGVVLGISTGASLKKHFRRVMTLADARGVVLQPMLGGMELFAGARYEPGFGHVVLCGMGGIFVEVMKDVASGLAPLSMAEATRMIRSLKGYKIMQGIRGQEGVDTELFASIIVRLSTVLRYATEIAELDLNPILGKGSSLLVVDARIRIRK